ncbi:hypothetical protein F3Y22_tig00110482pilonHSYRG00200 [Hibiscus syriacus]|uniref:Uncharacterized protein n=1 Tax=Hibiscus syriacus TaxID=106335 RepID=A0A6A3AH00_HIBSY|nr:hypothetical protein F3Y22_tig00110482pilonHSYRG00200 [Hibiscus syriacus]
MVMESSGGLSGTNVEGPLNSGPAKRFEKPMSVKKDGHFSCLSVSKMGEKLSGSFRYEKVELVSSQEVFIPRDRNSIKKQVADPETDTSNRMKCDARSYREWLGSRVRKDKVSGSHRKQSGNNSEACKKVKGAVVEGNLSCSKRRRVDFDSAQQCYSGNAEPGNRLHAAFPTQDGKESLTELNMDQTEERTSDVLDKESQFEILTGDGHSVCLTCMRGGKLLSCVGKGCKRKYHPSCLVPALSNYPPGFWHCIWCVEKKKELGVHSVSEVMSIWDAREVISDAKEMQSEKQYLVKYRGLAHVHNRWIPEKELQSEASTFVTEYNRRNQAIRWKSEWTIPNRFLQKRKLLFPTNSGDNDLDCTYEWLVKWTGLGYEHATWELESSSFMMSSESMKLIRDFEIRHQMSEGLSSKSEEEEIMLENFPCSLHFCSDLWFLYVLVGNSVRSSESPLSSRRLENCSAKASLDCQSHAVRNDVNGRSPSQGGNFRTEMLPSAKAKPARSEADDHHGIKKITKGYSNEKSSEVARGRRNGYQNWWKEGHTNGSNRCRSGYISLFIENLPEKIHWKRLESLFSTYGHVIDAFIPNKKNSKGGRFGFIRFATIEEARKAISSMNGVHIYDSRIRVSLAKYKPRQSYWRKSSKVVQRKSGMEEIPRIKHCEVEGVVDEEKLHVLSNCLVGWCKNFIKIGNLANQIQAKGLAGFTLMRAAGNVVLMVFEDSNSLRNVKDDKLETLAKWFSKVETWSESLMVESRRVWLVCEGIPFHAWNWDTFKNIATKWGKLIAIDNSCEFPSSFDRAKIQILTNAQGRINELFELKVGDHLFKILVHEVDPSFKPNSWVPEDCDISLELDPPIGL